MAALRIHQHGVNQMRVAFPFPPLALGAAGQIEHITALQHHALDRFGIRAGTGAGGIGARRRQRVPAIERDRRRQVDARVVPASSMNASSRARRSMNGSSRRSILRRRKQVVGAQMDRIFLDQFRRHRFAVEPLLQHVERLHAAVAQHQQARRRSRREDAATAQGRESCGDVLAGARIQPRLACAALIAACDRLHADAVPLPFRDEVGRVEIGEIRLLDRMRQHHQAERRRIEIDRLIASAFEPREQVEIGRRSVPARSVRPHARPCRRDSPPRSSPAAPKPRSASRR